jgi:DNA-binding SARP family transcriptional activator/predicted ATPase
MPQLVISLLGPFRVTLNETPVSGFVSKKAQALFAYLAVEAERPHTRQELQGLLWSDYLDSSARANLRSVLANLRRVIGDQAASPPFLQITRETIQFNRKSDHHRDVAVLDGVSLARKVDPAAVPSLEITVAQTQGPLLSGFSMSDSPAFEEWLLLKQEYYSQRLSDALYHLATYYEEQGAYDRALVYAQRWALLDPWHEEAHQQVMRLLARSGRRSQAVAHFEACRRILAAELGIEPSDETVVLVERIRRGELAGEPQAQPASFVANHLPRPLAPLIGRATELAELSRMLADPLQRLITIVGPGGIGKSHLALAVAASQSQQHRDGVALIALAPLESADGLTATFAKALEFTFDQSAPPEQQLLNYLRNKEMLLLMDNFEHLLDGRWFIQNALDAAPHLKFLATSRIRLQVRGEQLFPLDGLAYPEEESASAEDPPINEASHDAIALFMQSVRRLRPGFGRVMGASDFAEIGRICRLVRGMPLAILLASTWIELLTPREIADEIELDFQFLQVDGHGLPQRHHSLQAVFEHSWQLLTTEEQTLFLRFSVFRGGCTRHAAQAVTGAALTHLLALTNKFFLSRMSAQQGGVVDRYEVHELLRQFAAHKLSQCPDDEKAVQQRHSAYYAAFLSRHTDDLKGSRQVEARAEIEVDGENVRAAWQWAVEQQQLEYMEQAVTGLAIVYEWRGRYQDGEAVCRAAVEQLAQTELHTDRHLLATLLTWQARFNRYLGHAALANQLAQDSLNLLNSLALGDRDVRAQQATTLLELGELAPNLVEARELFQQALSLARAAGDRWGMAQGLHLLGDSLCVEPGTDAEGQHLLTESLGLFQSLGDRRNAAIVLQKIGFFAMLRGQHAQGEELLRQSLAINREMSSVVDIKNAIPPLATGLLFNGKFGEAFTLAQEYERFCQNLGNRPSLARAESLLSTSCLFLGRYENALEHALRGLELTKEVNDSGRISFVLWNLGDILLAQRAYSEAERHLQESIFLHRKMANQGRLMDVLTSLGFAAYGLGQIMQLQRSLTEALEMTAKERFWYTTIRCIPLAALFAITQGRPEQAVELYSLALCAPHIANSPWYEEVAGRHVRAAAQMLPNQAISAAEERGRARDLWETAAETLLAVAAVGQW